MKILNYKKEFEALCSEMDRLRGERDIMLTSVKEHSAEIEKCRKIKDTADKAIWVLHSVIEGRQSSVTKLFEETVTSALREVFGADYDFKLEFSKRNNVTTIEYMLHTDEYDGHIPLKYCQGKSVQEIVSVILRIMFVSMMKGRKFLVLDESISGIEIDKEWVVGKLVKDVCENFGVQVLMVSHKKTLYEMADKRIEL